MTSIIQRMDNRKRRLAVAQMRYNQLRSRVPNAEIAVVEGAEDPLFYSSAFQRAGNTTTEHFLIANGKDNVLGLRALLLQSKDMQRGGGVVFLVDRDYDDLKGHTAGPDIYMTPTYSFENVLVCRTAIRRLLMAEFKLGDPDLIEDVEKVLTLFDRLLNQHASELAEANEVIHCVRQEQIVGNELTTGPISDQERQFADLHVETMTVRKIATGTRIETLITAKSPISSEVLAKHRSKFSSLEPSARWRGKFLFFLLRRFIATLVEDRNSKNPRIFSKGDGKISFDHATNSLVRILASICSIPSCLSDFASSIPARKLM